VKGKTWQETVRLSREALAKLEVQQDATPTTPRAPRKGAYTLGTWYVIGPFYRDGKPAFDVAFPPEKEIDLTKSYGSLRWQKKPKFEDGVPNMSLRAGDHGSTYLTRTITARKPVTITGYFGSDDGLAVWLNGEKLISNDVMRGVLPGSDTAKLALKKGENQLLLKIYNARGNHGFYFSTSRNPRKGGSPEGNARAKARDALWAYVARGNKRNPSAGIEMAAEQADGIWHADWQAGDLAELAQRYIKAIRLPSFVTEAKGMLASVESESDLAKVRQLYYRSRAVEQATARINENTFEALRLAIDDLSEHHPDRYTNGQQYRDRVDALEKDAKALAVAVHKGDAQAIEKLAALGDDLATLRREALLANPLLDFDRLLVIRRVFGSSARKVISNSLGMPSLNSHVHTAIRSPGSGWDNEIAVLTGLRAEVKLTRLYRPEGGRILCDVDLHFNADRMLFSMFGTHDRWHIFELGADGSTLTQLTPKDMTDVDHFDACYLPNGRIAFTSTAGYQGLPCEYGGKPMAQLYIMARDGSDIRQITFEQDSDWCPVVRNDGRLMYLRWEYPDTPHYFTRILFHCNPDGTEQMEYYGSNSYFPNAFMFPRPIPGHPTKVVGIAGGHHGISRSGRLLILDPSLGRHEADGVVQEIPGRGRKVEPIIRDRLVDGVWPQFLHPYPLDEKYFLVSAKLDPSGLWGIYLVDVFDNLTLIKEVEGEAFLEPLPFRKTKTPPVIPDKVEPGRKDALVYLMDVYKGPGLAGVPRGAVKKLRIFGYHFAYVRRGGHNVVGIESGWDVKRLLGTVPVEPDGSASFRIPANQPIAVQPLDEKGRALQLMRSWFVGMPGEIVSCVGCHEPQNSVPHNTDMLALKRPPSEIEPWRGPARPFAFATEVQPVLDRYCVGCHDGSKADRPNFIHKPTDVASLGKRGATFGGSYAALQPYLRRPGPEGDYHMLRPMEYHASTSELVQMLEKGHHNVALDAEAWDRLQTWVDLNVPYVGHWLPDDFAGYDQHKRRIELAKRYANVDVDPEAEFRAALDASRKRGPIQPVKPEQTTVAQAAVPQVQGWPFDAAMAQKLQEAVGARTARVVDLGGGVAMEMALVPAGEFVMGSVDGYADEAPPRRVRVERPFWMGVCEVSNQQYARFDSIHDSRYFDRSGKDHGNPGWPANQPDQPVIRVTWQRAMAFCEWLSAKTGERFMLPTEAEWEWACRAGTATELSFGGVDANFSNFANLADKSGASARTTPFPATTVFNDGAQFTGVIADREPNAWGLRNMHGNVAEWTRSVFRPYPYKAGDGRDALDAGGLRVVRGGSWRDRPHRARSAFRLAFQPYQPLDCVGFRVVCEVKAKVAAR
jgi:formylglycine-generating enzyme required for sulfatase activity